MCWHRLFHRQEHALDVRVYHVFERVQVQFIYILKCAPQDAGAQAISASSRP